MSRTLALTSLFSHTARPTFNNDLRPPNRFSVDTIRYFLVAKVRRQFYAHFVINYVTGQSLEYCHFSHGPNADVCSHSLAKNLGHLAQGFGTRMPNVTNTVFFIRK